MQPDQPVPAPQTTKPKRSIVGQLPLLIALLIIGCLLVAYRPSESGKASERTVTVSGEAQITAEPDEYVFRPQYDFKNADQKAALAAATAKTNAVVKGLKDLGVPDRKIKTDTSGYGSYYYYDDNQQTYYASVTVTLDDKKLAQKVQDYLLTTTPYGSVTPQANFSKAKLKQLTDEGRDKATKDARAKAEQSARNLGFKIGKVKTFTDSPDSSNFDTRILGSVSSDAAGSSAKPESAPIQQGEDSLTYKVSVTYYIK